MKSLRDHTLADYVVVAISPALIVAMIGSLVYFLLEVAYQGEFQGRMRWILFFYVFGSVLVARVAMHADAAPRAPLYSLIMAAAAWVGLGMFVEYPADLVAISWVINLGLVWLVWWSAKKITWDCTYIEDEVDAGRAGLLKETGLGKSATKAEPRVEQEDEKVSWWERFVRYRDAERKKHTPGKWVVYFSLAALPIFGLGQSLIPAEDVARRRYTFLLMAVYVASGLGLLLTTCFLGLRRYLRQRNLKMPAKMVGSWLTLGGGLVAVLLLLGAVLPRPNSETSLVDLTPLGSKKRDASKQSFVKDGGGKDKGQPGETQQQKDGPAPGKDSQGGKDGQGQKGGDGKDQQNGQGGKQQDGKGGNQSESGKKSGGQKGQQRDQGQKKGGDPKTTDGSSSDREEAKSNKDQQQKQEGSSSSPPKTLLPHLPEMGQLSQVLKWVVFGVLAAVVVFCLLRSGLQWLANFTKWARDLLESLRAFWARLFGRREGVDTSEPDAEPVARMPPMRPFASFRNPFEDGSAGRLPPEQVIRYSFAAFQAWARERDMGRPTDETPLEFAARVGAEVPALEEAARRLATLYAAAVYARGSIPQGSLETVRQFWVELESVAEQPLSA